MGQRKLDQCKIAFEFQLAADVGPVGFNCAVANEKLGGDVFAGLIVGDQPQYPMLHRSQCAEAGFFRRQDVGPRSALEKEG